MFLEATREVANRYPFIQYEEMIIDNCCMQVTERLVQLWYLPESLDRQEPLAIRRHGYAQPLRFHHLQRRRWYLRWTRYDLRRQHRPKPSHLRTSKTSDFRKKADQKYRLLDTLVKILLERTSLTPPVWCWVPSSCWSISASVNSLSISKKPLTKLTEKERYYF